jgi:hypothetical protein
MPVCPKCKRSYAAAPPVMLPKHLTDPPGAMLKPEDNKDYRTKLTSFG